MIQTVSDGEFDQGAVEAIKKADTKNDAGEQPEMTHEEVEQAKADAGLAVLDSKKIRGFKKIGKFLRAQGFVEVAQGRLVGRLEALERARRVMLELVEDKVVFMSTDQERPVVHHEVVLAAANALVAVVRAENEIDALAIKFDGAIATAPNMAPLHCAPPPDRPFVAIKTEKVEVHGSNFGDTQSAAQP